MFSVFFGTFAKAALVGAKTVYFVLPERVFARPAFSTSETSVENWGAPAAVSTMFLLGAAAAGPALTATSTPIVATIARNLFILQTSCSRWWCSALRGGRAARLS